MNYSRGLAAGSVVGATRPAPRMTETRLVDIGDAELHVEITGTGRPVILAAGLGGRGAFWHNQIQPFAEHFQVITFDHRGCGSSTRGLCVTGVAQMADDLIRMLDELNIDRASVVGHSTGGAIGQHIAITRPDRLTALVLSCSWPGPDPYFTALFTNRREVLEKCGAEAYLAYGTFLAMPSSHLQPVMREEDPGIAARLKAFPGTDVEMSRIAAVMAHDLRAQLHRIVTPTLCIGALDDQITPPGFTHELAELIPTAHAVLLDRGGHFAPIASTQAYNRAVLAFLADGQGTA